APTKEAVREAAGRCADVQARAPRNVEAELLQSVLELHPATRDEATLPVHQELGVARHELPRLRRHRSIAPNADASGAHGSRRAGSRRGQPALGQEGVDASALHVANGTWRSAGWRDLD